MILPAALAALLAVAGQAAAQGFNFTVPRNGSNSTRPSVSNADTSFTLLYQNNLNLTDDPNHVGAILLDAMPPSAAAAACQSIGEKLLPRSSLAAHYFDVLGMLSYHSWRRKAPRMQTYVIDGGTLSVLQGVQQMSYPMPTKNSTASGNATSPSDASAPDQGPMPVLCSQTGRGNQAANAAATASNQIRVASGGGVYVGFRNQKSFRFVGIPYAEPPRRFEYPVVFNATNRTIQATEYGSQCVQNPGGGSEDCLFLNVWTPYIPKAGSADDLRPVLIWIHGGGLTGGSGSALDTDGGQLASREDIVTVTLNYRLSTLGFLAVPGTDVTGNYGIADQSLALQVRVRSGASESAALTTGSGW